MKFISQSNINIQVAASDYYMPQINIDKHETKQLVQSMLNKVDEDIILQEINVLKQNITSIDISDYSYTHLGKRLQFSELSRGEKVFLVSLAAKYTGEIIYLQHDILQLTKTNLRKYYAMFNECNNINIICHSEEEIAYLQNVMRGVIK